MANYGRIGYIHDTRYQVQFKGHISGKRSYNCHRSGLFSLCLQTVKLFLNHVRQDAYSLEPRQKMGKNYYSLS